MPVPERSILVAPQTDSALAQLLALAEPLARSEPRARAHPRPRAAPAAQRRRTRRAADRAAAAHRRLQRGREGAARAAAARCRRALGGADLGAARAGPRQALGAEEVDLVLVDGRRPLLGVGVPRGDVGALLRESPARRGGARGARGGRGAARARRAGARALRWRRARLGRARARRVAGGGDQGARCSCSAPPRASGRWPTRRCSCSASRASPPSRCWPSPARPASRKSARAPGLLVIGLSERWRQEGLGPTRSDIARYGPSADHLRAPRHASRAPSRPADRRHALRLVVAVDRRALVLAAQRVAAACAAAAGTARSAVASSASSRQRPDTQVAAERVEAADAAGARPPRPPPR